MKRELAQALAEALLEPQPPPTGEGESVTDLAMSYQFKQLLEKRRKQGLERYGTELRTHNGRWALADMTQEAVDGLLYATQYVHEATEEQDKYTRKLIAHAWRELLRRILDHAGDPHSRNGYCPDCGAEDPERGRCHTCGGNGADPSPMLPWCEQCRVHASAECDDRTCPQPRDGSEEDRFQSVYYRACDLAEQRTAAKMRDLK